MFLGWIELADIQKERTKIQMYSDDRVIRIDAVWRELDWKVLTLQIY